MIELTSPKLDHTVELGRRLGRLARAGDVLALHGELGAGKTQLVRGVAEGMGLDPAAVSSPTFVIVHEYLPPEASPPKAPETPSGAAPANDTTALVHIDAYRLSGPDDLATIGFDDELRRESVVAVEWAARIDELAPGALGEDRLDVHLQHTANDTRAITLTPRGRWAGLRGELQNLSMTAP